MFVNRVSGIGYRISGIGYRVSGVWYRVSGIGCRVSGIGYRVSGIGYRVSGVWYRVIGYRVSGVGYRVSGLGYRVSATHLNSNRRQRPDQSPNNFVIPKSGHQLHDNITRAQLDLRCASIGPKYSNGQMILWTRKSRKGVLDWATAHPPALDLPRKEPFAR